jgi:hypothetical protein
MAERTTQGSGAIVAVFAIACVCALLAMIPARASAAGNTTYCWGTWIHNHNEWCSFGTGVSSMTELVGSGEQHSVCVWAAAGQTQCSGGPLQGVYNTSMAGCTTNCGIPSISNNGFDWNKVFGRVYWS